MEEGAGEEPNATTARKPDLLEVIHYYPFYNFFNPTLPSEFLEAECSKKVCK